MSNEQLREDIVHREEGATSKNDKTIDSTVENIDLLEEGTTSKNDKTIDSTVENIDLLEEGATSKNDKTIDSTVENIDLLVEGTTDKNDKTIDSTVENIDPAEKSDMSENGKTVEPKVGNVDQEPHDLCLSTRHMSVLGTSDSLDVIPEDGTDIQQPINFMDPQTIEMIKEAKKNYPEQFASFWEMDEQDVDEATEEEIQNNPSLRMLWAAENGNLEVMREMRSQDASLINTTDTDGYTPLHRAAYENHVSALHYLLSEGAELSARTHEGWTPLHSACRWDALEAASVLIRYGADVNATTNGNLTPLHLVAAHTDTPALLQMLLMHSGIRTDIRNTAGETAFQLCQRSNGFYYLFEICDPHIVEMGKT